MMIRSQTIAVALAALLTVLLADSTASAQRACRPQSSRSKCNAYTRASCSSDERLKAIETYFQTKKLNVRERAELKRERIRQRLWSASHIDDTKSNKKLEQPYLTSSDVERYREHYAAKVDITKIKLEAQVDITKIRLEAQAEIEEIERRHRYQQTMKCARRLARQSAPKRLTESEYNPITGVIRWPSLFHADQRFAENRQWIDTLAAQGAHYKDARGSGHLFEIRKAAGQMQNTLKNTIRELDGTEYAAAKAFLASLAHQTRLAAEPAIGSLAAK